MKNKLTIISVSCLLMAASACSCPNAPRESARVGEQTRTTSLGDGVAVTTQDKRSLMASGKIAGEETVLISNQSKVQSIDRAKKTLVLRSPQGRLTSVKVGDAVRNFNQIKVGDEVAVDYYASVVFETRPPTQEEVAMADDGPGGVASRARLGDKPAGFAAVSNVSILTVENIDRVNNTISVLDRAGKLTVIKARYPENLSYIAKGDKVVATTTEAVAAKIAPVL